ncbi:MAG: ABC transporter permease [Clostridia bacterium]|nr:ABC transporter permease [Clostridia bacterium]
MGLLFLNAFKGLKFKKVQMIGIIFCIILSTSIYTAMNTALDRMEDRYHNYLKEQNVEDFSFIPKIDYAKDYTKEEIEELKKNELKDIPAQQMNLVNQYQMTIGIENIPNIDNLYKAIEYIFNNNGANDKKLEGKMAETKQKYDFNYTKETVKVSTHDKYLYKSIPYTGSETINVPYVVEGRLPEKDNEITVLPAFANKNDIKLNDKYTIGETEYTIVGFVNSPNHIFPLISINRPMYNEKTDNIMYMNEATFEAFSGVKESSYIAAFNDREKTMEFETLGDLFMNDENISLNPLTALKLLRVNSLEAEIATSRLFSEYFLYLLLGISIFVIIVITKKRIEDERLQIGVLKSLGYKSLSIAVSYLVYPIIGSLIGGVIGYGIGVLAHEPLTNMYVSYFNLPIEGFKINLTYLFNSTILPLILLSVLAFLIAIFMLRKKPLQLLKEGSNLKVNLLSRFVTFVTRKFPFKTRFKLSLASRSLGKLAIVTLTSFCTGLLIVLVLIGMNMFESMISKTFDGLDFKNSVSYQAARTDTSEVDDLIYNTSIDLIKVKRENGTIEEVDLNKKQNNNRMMMKKSENNEEEKEAIKKMSVTMNGIDTVTHYITIKDKEGNDLLGKLKDENDIIINKNISEIINVTTGDTLIFENADKEYEFTIVGIQDSFMGNQAYCMRNYISTLFEDTVSYNAKYTSDPKYDNMSNIPEDEMNAITSVFSIGDLKDNMGNQFESSNGAIYFVIAFASVLALVIILVIANIIVEENKKTISLMKVMGYKNKVISQIVLNIYTPFVVIAYLLSIPAMKAILTEIVKALTKDMELAIPIEFSIIKALAGLVGLLVAYYFAIFISRKSLDKIPLSIALKRE